MNGQKMVSSHLYAAEKTRGQKLSELPTFLQLARAGTGYWNQGLHILAPESFPLF